MNTEGHSSRLKKNSATAVLLLIVLAVLQLLGSENVPLNNFMCTSDNAALSTFLEARADEREGIKLGLFDPSRAFSGDSRVSIEHLFVEWQAEAARLRAAVRQAERLNRQLMLTIEPWPWWRWQRDRQDSDQQVLLSDIKDGRYDFEINEVCGQIGAVDGAVLVRWGHEMEDGRYPWANAEPSDYVEAFRYFVSNCRLLAPNTLFVWSPKGHRGLNQYYPGDDYVDFIGLSLYAAQKTERAYYGEARSAVDALSERYTRISQYKKLVIVAELGVSGDDSYIKTWFAELSDQLAVRFPLVRAMVYFNAPEPHRLPEPFGAPDWRVGTGRFLS